MKLIFLGPPGAGKGTQAKMISTELNIPHISTGDIFRENLKNDTALGQEAANYMNKGLLVPDEVTNNMVKDRLSRNDCQMGYILDGYPRTINQAQFLDNLENIDKVINFQLGNDEVIKRISGRRTCPNCKKMYHILFNPPITKDVCECGSNLIQREDDKEEAVAVRLDVYNKQTAPLIEYYTAKGSIINIDARPKIDEIYNTTIKFLKEIK